MTECRSTVFHNKWPFHMKYLAAIAIIIWIQNLCMCVSVYVWVREDEQEGTHSKNGFCAPLKNDTILTNQLFSFP